jgi:hypothetical protein
MSALLQSPGVQHLISGLAIIGTVAGLAATGTINGTDALGLIAAVGSFLLGGTLAVNAASQASSTTTVVPAQPTQAVPAPPVAAAPPAA